MSILDYIEKIKSENEGPRITAQKPRTMAQAPIAEDLEPGALRDEMLKGFDPSQETHEEYLQRINLERPFNAAHGGSAGQLVRNTADGSRPGYAKKKWKAKLKPETYSGDFKTWYETADIKGQTPLEKYGPFDELEKGIRGAIKSRDYPRWLERSAKLKDLRKTGHIPLEEFFAKHDVPDHYRTQMEFTSTSGRRKFNRSWFKKNLEKHVVNLEFSQAGGGGLFIKEPGKKLTKEFIKVFTTPDVTMRPDTVKNINKLWKIYGESHYAKGTFPPIEEVIKKMGGKFDMTSHAAATATRRISQIMNGTNFIGTDGKYISTNVIADKKAAKGILDKFQLEGFYTPYGGANYKINLEIVKEGLPEYTKGQSLGTWRDNARAILKDHGVKFYIKNKQAGFNLNELTGMGSGAQHGSYTSTQFVNLMEGKFNQTKHAALLKKYGEFEGKIKSSLSGPKPNVTEARKLNKEWIDWRKNWLEGVDSKLKPQVSKILPGFDFRANAAEKVFGKKRLNELMGHGLDVAGETRELRYLKTFGDSETMRKMPILKEVAMGEEKAINQIKNWNKVINNSKAKITAKALESAGVTDICSTQLVKKAGGGRIGFARKKCGVAFAAENPDEFMKAAAKSEKAADLFKSGNIAKHLMKAKNWAKSNMGPAGWIGGELLIMGLGAVWDRSQGKGWKEALDNWTGLGGHFGQAEKRLKQIGIEQGYSEQEINDAMKIGQLMDLSTELEEDQLKLDQLLEAQDIGGTARVKYDPNLIGAYKPPQGQYQDPKRLRDLKTEVPKMWEKGTELYESLKDYGSSVGLYDELQQKKKREEYDRMMKFRSTPMNLAYGQQFQVSGDPQFSPWVPEQYAGGGMVGIRKPNALPPTGGPQSGGLPSLYNNVRKR